MAGYQGFLADFFRCALISSQHSVEVGGMGKGERRRGWKVGSASHMTQVEVVMTQRSSRKGPM